LLPNLKREKDRDNKIFWDQTHINIYFTCNYQIALTLNVLNPTLILFRIKLTSHKILSLNLLSMNLIPLARSTGNIPILTGGILQEFFPKPNS
jgi:hypothetical protein